MIKLPQLRYYLEIISVPVFAFLVVHLAGHGMMLLKDSHHSHEHETHNENLLNFDFLFSAEILGGILALLFFIWIWHLPVMKKFVPCSHDHCHHLHIWGHLAATGAFLFHFFPESVIRYEMLQDFNWHNLLNVIGGIGFFSHFLVDIIVMFLLASFWKKPWQKFLSFGFIVSIFCFLYWRTGRFKNRRII